MAVLVIAGSGRGAGKTAVGCALMAAMPELSWIGVKVSPHQHDSAGHCWEERNQSSKKDTGRYLAAGARRAFLTDNPLSVEFAACMNTDRSRKNDAEALLVESNQVSAEMIAGEQEQVVSIAVVCGPEAEWKTSLRSRIHSVDALVLTGRGTRSRLSAALVEKAIFRLAKEQWSSPELIKFVRERLGLNNH